MKRDKIEEVLNQLGNEELPADVQKLAEQTSEEFSQALIKSSQPKHYIFGDYIMKSRFTQLAAAAVIILAVFIGIGVLNPGSGSVTFAQVIEPILKARTIAYDFIVGDETDGTVMRDIVVGSKIRRTLSNIPGMAMIIDLDNSNMLVLSDEDNSATYVDIQGQLQERSQGYLKFLQEVVTNNKDNYKKLGEQQIDGRTVIVFVAGGTNEGVKVWADPDTALPIRIELTIGQMFAILKNFEFDMPIEDSLISMDMPSGYTLKETDVALGDSTEEDFIESLRIWAEIICDGTFPEAIGTENVMKQVSVLGEKIGQMNLPEDEAMKLGMSFGKGLMFHQMLETVNGGEYVGAGVKFGDADAPVFMYQPEGSQNYRVIYGDLSVKEVAPGDLPK